MKKILSLLLVCLLALGMMSGCQQNNTAADTAKIASVGDAVITVGEMKYAVGVVKSSLTVGKEGQALEDFWNTLIDGVDPEDYIRDNAIDLLVDMAVFAQVAKEHGISVTDDEINQYFDQNKETITNITEQFGVTEDTLKEIYRKQLLYDKYGQTVLAADERFNPSEEVLKDYFAKNFYKAQHILKMTVDSATNAPLTQAEKDAARAEIDAILLAIRDGADFEEMMLTHTEDPGVEQSPQGYVFTEGEMVPEFYEGTIALSEGQVSDVIESSYGYHIIKRLPLDAEAEFQTNAYNVQTAYVYAMEEQLLEELKTTYEISIDDAKLKEIPVK